MAELAALYPFAAIVPVSAEKGSALDALLAEVRAAAAGRRRRSSARTRSPIATSASSPPSSSARRSSACSARRCRTRRRSRSTASSTRATLRRIHATVYVDRENQRAILLGAGGAQMKEIATQRARRHGAAVRRQGVPRGLGARQARLGRRRRAAHAASATERADAIACRPAPSRCAATTSRRSCCTRIRIARRA